ncbi:hypothetical protein L1987_30262 [Smallanthus sonchifolius]|uniref:Uncharacterized protein n=1 Tax=Smallanthus sonchifolius TaxID=185202 RepID=A0ACB9I3R6_9ASTR|nr:hypothetical protein L1987_30262 [Smallanthus sonchifolius]
MDQQFGHESFNEVQRGKKPLFRAKVPLSILGLPFQSGIVAGESKELSLNLSTFFESGPSVKIAYRPNDSANPFSLVFKTGIGHYGSPISSALNMSAEFNLIGGSQNPSFFVHFKPQFGDFSVKKIQSSVFKKQVAGGGGVSDEDAPFVVDLFDSGKKFSASPLVSPATGVVRSLLSDVDLTATTAIPLGKNATLNFRWGLRLPATVLMKKSNQSTAAISFQNLPVLLINKIGIEHVARADCRRSNKVGPPSGDVADAFLAVRKQLEIIQAENGTLRKTMDGLKGEFAAVKSGTNAVKVNGNKGNYNKEVIAHFGGKAIQGEVVNDE